MELKLSNIHDQIKTIKETVFSLVNTNPYSLVSPSAYETAWLAMIPNSTHKHKPMFNNCLNWVIKNQNKQGFWGDCDAQGMPTIECLTATLACIVALNRWNVGTIMINKGMIFCYMHELF